MKPIPVIRAAYVNLILDELAVGGFEGEATLAEFNLPVNLGAKADCYLVMQPVLALMRWSALMGGEELLTRAFSRVSLAHFSSEVQRLVASTSSLETALQRFCANATRELSVASVVVEHKGDEVLVSCTLKDPGLAASAPCLAPLLVASVAAVVRYFAGNAGDAQCARLAGDASASIRFPASLLRLSSATHGRPAPGPGVTNSMVAAPGNPEWDFPASLRAVLQPYLDCEYPDLKLAARIVGVSRRTLQRRLESFDVSYTELVQEARLQTAMTLLRRPDHKIIDAAYAVGYADPSHFARAFRRMSGVSPRQYRRRLMREEPQQDWREMAR